MQQASPSFTEFTMQLHTCFPKNINPSVITTDAHRQNKVKNKLIMDVHVRRVSGGASHLRSDVRTEQSCDVYLYDIQRSRAIETNCTLNNLQMK